MSEQNQHTSVISAAADKRKIESLNPVNKIEHGDANRNGNRQAIVHTLDISSKNSRHAANLIKGFRQGQYTNNVDFHVGDVSNWIDSQTASRQNEDSDVTNKTFLSHIVLDLPRSEDHAQKIASALRVNGTLLVFYPSITQIVAWVKEIKKKKLPLQQDQILEMGQGISGGREWDVRAVKPRALIGVGNIKLPKRDVKEVDVVASQEDATDVEKISTIEAIGDARNQPNTEDGTGWEIVCRPKVGDRVIGGGFLGVWKKMKDRREEALPNKDSHQIL